MRRIAPACLLSSVLLFGSMAEAATSARPGPAHPAASAADTEPGAGLGGERIVAVVNGDVISQGDVTARTRLFALSTGLPMTPEVLARLRPQVTRATHR